MVLLFDLSVYDFALVGLDGLGSLGLGLCVLFALGLMFGVVDVVVGRGGQQVVWWLSCSLWVD